MYITDGNGRSHFAGSKTFVISGPSVGSLSVSNINAGAGTFRVTVGGINAKAGVREVEVAVWSKSDQSNLKWYTATRQSDGSYALNVNIANHGYEYGTYKIHAYLYDNNGIYVVKGGTATIAQPKAILQTTLNSANTQCTIKATNVGYAGGVKNVEVAVWSVTGGQDDLVWYQLKNYGSGTWSGTVPIVAHRSAGTYQAHMYITDGNGRSHFIGSNTFRVN